ncbi:hypothetical protein INT44_004561 [Umbelopsis vinacea]|uniref:Cytochrome b5 heme-binding domain-containing protein n=1 Tax=Umbelopsis vinacea TaxID=44442 RepID=A0A8H7QAJ8_9FUNG|nr:hypothetical protein INT44_004561 [Umbelopsis vinacea]
MLDSQLAAYEKFKSSSSQSRDSEARSRRSKLSNDPSLPRLNSIHQGRVVKIMEFGAFIQMVDVTQQGLVHRAQVCIGTPGKMNQIYTRSTDNAVFHTAVESQSGRSVKIVDIDEDDSGKVKIGLSMKYVNQGNGDDLANSHPTDTGNVNHGRELENRKKGNVASTFNRAPIELTDAVMMNVVCRKCGGKGHLPSECFNDSDKKYELIPEDEELDYDLTKKRERSHKKEHSHRKEHKSKKHKKRKRETSRSASPEVRSVNSVADALSLMRKRSRKEHKKAASQYTSPLIASPLTTNMPELKSYTREEVKKHNTPEDCWIIIDSEVFNMTTFADLHPGGAGVIMDLAGKDATEEFYGLHRQEVLFKYAPKLKIGTIANEKPVIEMYTPGTISKVPYGEASAWQGHKSPYFTESHIKFRSAIRKIYDEMLPEALLNEDLGKSPTIELNKKLGAAGVLATQIGPGPWLQGLNLPGGVKPEEFDYFHEMIAHEETARLGTPGFADGITAGLTIGLPPIFNFGSPAMKSKIVPEVLSGEKRICLAITEPFTGSDVAGIRTTAKLSADGKHFIVNGTKKWITNSVFCDYFCVAVRTAKGISMLLVEKSDGLEVKPIKTSYSIAAGTGYITFEDVKVPVENLLGKEGKGFQVIMANFNHERWAIICGIIAGSRHVLEETFKWTNQRVVFGKKLSAQPVVRSKLANMIAQIESVQNWLENITYQMVNMSYAEQTVKLAGPIALLKYQSTRVAHNISDEATQIFGGRGITKTGMGRVIETFQRTYKFAAILGGSEEIMQDLGVRQALRTFPDARL